MLQHHNRCGFLVLMTLSVVPCLGTQFRFTPLRVVWVGLSDAPAVCCTQNPPGTFGLLAALRLRGGSEGIRSLRKEAGGRTDGSEDEHGSMVDWPKERKKTTMNSRNEVEGLEWRMRKSDTDAAKILEQAEGGRFDDDPLEVAHDYMDSDEVDDWSALYKGSEEGEISEGDDVKELVLDDSDSGGREGGAGGEEEANAKHRKSREKGGDKKHMLDGDESNSGEVSEDDRKHRNQERFRAGPAGQEQGKGGILGRGRREVLRSGKGLASDGSKNSKEKPKARHKALSKSEGENPKVRGSADSKATLEDMIKQRMKQRLWGEETKSASHGSHRKVEDGEGSSEPDSGMSEGHAGGHGDDDAGDESDVDETAAVTRHRAPKKERDGLEFVKAGKIAKEKLSASKKKKRFCHPEMSNDSHELRRNGQSKARREGLETTVQDVHMSRADKLREKRQRKRARRAQKRSFEDETGLFLPSVTKKKKLMLLDLAKKEAMVNGETSFTRKMFEWAEQVGLK